MKLTISALLVAVLCALVAHSPAALVGAPMKHDPKEFENYLDEAHFVASSQVEGREFYDTVVEILEAETQVVSGVIYRLRMKMTQSTCKVSKGNYSKELCVPKKGKPVKICEAEVYSRAWENYHNVNSFTCEAAMSIVTRISGVLDPKDLTFAYLSKHLKLSQERSLFSVFVRTYNKTYKDKEEHEARFMIFKNNLKRIALFNRLEEGTAHYGLTEFSDLSPSEFERHYLGLKKDLSEHKEEVKPIKVGPVHEPLPDLYDWRTKGAVTDVKNQGSCGSCWAFSVTGNVEGQWFLSRNKLLSLSEQELVDCDKVDHGCRGGYMGQGLKAVIEMGGLETESDYPYKGVDGMCKFNKTESQARVQSFVGLPQNETELAYWLMKHGPVSIGINANAMQFYFGGISHPWKFLCSPTDIDHGVLLVGFGVDKRSFRQKPVPYWIIKNSWGKYWGEKGYYRVYRGDGTCGVNQMALSAVVPPMH